VRAFLSRVANQIGLYFAKQSVVVGSGKVLNIDQAAVAIVLTPAAAISFGALQLSEGVIARNQSAIPVILYVVPIGSVGGTAAGTGFDLLKVMVGRDTKGLLEATHQLSWGHMHDPLEDVLVSQQPRQLISSKGS
jgi:hypothetical protein